MTVDIPARRRRLEPDERRTQILTVARRLFGAGTYESVSTSDIAAEAGVARALINHYFGSKRALYLEVVRQMVTVPALATEDLPRTTMDQRIAISVDRWLDIVERNKQMWLAAIGHGAIGKDDALEQILREADDIDADRVLQAAMMSDIDAGREELRAMIRCYASMLRAASREWLVRGTLTRSDLHVLLTDSLLHLIKVAFPAVLAGKHGAS
ncbi:MAG: TetR/AcrR family transcriptional regulator [Sciscionella sp.]